MNKSTRLTFVSRNLCSVVRSGMVAAALLAATTLSAGATTLETANATTGNQAYSYVGLAFNVNQAITVTQFGIWASGLSAITANLSEYLFTDLTNPDHVQLAVQTFTSTSEGTLTDGYWFKDITPVTLQPGTYILATYGWTPTEKEANCYAGGPCQTFNSGGGLVTLDGDQYGNGSDPAGVLGAVNGIGGTNSFAAENMVFAAVPPPPPPSPEPSSILLLAGGLLAGISARRRAAR